ncbi:MAG: flavodoxin, partial [Lachnospiraceae bacterium]|nr:flavodoxin [Lachnospiraceae bacterium]
MTNILFINSCVRSGSRTKRLADCLLSKLKEQADDRSEEIRIEEVRTFELSFPETDEAFLLRRDSLIAAKAYDDPLFSPARQFAAADCIVIA